MFHPHGLFVAAVVLMDPIQDLQPMLRYWLRGDRTR